MTSHAKPATHPHLAHTLEPVLAVLSALAAHYLGVLATIVGLLLTAGGVTGFLLAGHAFPAVLVGLIGLSAISICITYWVGGQ